MRRNLAQAQQLAFKPASRELDFTAMSLLDDHVSKAQCKRAVEALLTHASKFEEAKAETQLFSGKEQNVWLVVNTKVMHPEKKLKPARM